MAKKKFNISSTLKKNTAEPVPTLAKKIPLKKNEKDLDEVKEKVAEIHAEEAEVVKAETLEVVEEKPIVEAIPVAAPVKSRTSSRTKKVAEPEKVKLVRLTIDTPEPMHKELKVKAVLAGISMRDYILKLIEKDLKKSR